MPKVVISEIGFNGNFDNINKGNKLLHVATMLQLIETLLSGFMKMKN